MAKPDRLARNLIDSCLELHRRRTWSRVEADAPFLLRILDEEEPLAGVLMGQAGQEFGLMLSRGPDALDRLFRGILCGDPESAHADELDMLSVSFERLGAVPSEFRKPLQLAGFQTRRENIAPLLFSRPPHQHPRAVNKREMKTMLWALGALFAAEDRGELGARRLSPGGKVLELEVSGKWRAPELKTRFVPWSPSAVSDLSTPVLLPADLGALPRTRQCWLATTVPLPGRIEGDDRAWRALLLVDRESGEMICSELVPSGEAGSLVPPLAGVLRARGLPRELVFAEELLLDVLAPGLATLGVRALLEPDLPVFEELHEAFRAGPEFSAGPKRSQGAPETLEEWKEVELEFVHRQGELIDREEVFKPRALKRYFGSEAEAAEVLEELSEISPFPAFFEWLVADYRPTKRSKTQLEKRLLERDLDPVERTLIEARCGALLSIFRVDSVQLGASFEVEDLFGGGRYTVQDRALSACDIEGFFLPLRLIRVREWYFPLVAGPPLSVLQVDRFVSRLESIGLELDREGMRAGAHLVGRLWSWFLEARANPPKLQNTDGDPFEWQRARFHVARPALFVKALERRRDVSVDEPGAAWTWSRAGGPTPGVGERTTLGTLELFDDSLLLEVNSARRLERARRWVEELPGVSFEDAAPVDPGERPLDDQLPGPPPAPLPAELRGELEGLMLEQGRRWLDEPVPALGGLTPRAACRTEEGRRRVERMIRSMAPMQIPGGAIPPPREELMRELGLEGR